MSKLYVPKKGETVRVVELSPLDTDPGFQVGDAVTVEDGELTKDDWACGAGWVCITTRRSNGPAHFTWCRVEPVVAAPPVASAVEHPPHYTSHPSGVECITIAQHHNFCVGNAIKYLWRQGLKAGNPSTQDLRKAAKYIEFEIARLEVAADGEVSP